MTSWAVEYRPRSFKEIYGQDMANEVLKGIIRRQQPPPAVICCGRTGTGKTTTLRVYFKAVNCLSPQDGEPCNQCDMCAAFNSNSCPDFLEVDASTAGGVEQMRQLAQDAKLVPLRAKKRCVLLDEVHAMSRDGFNVLLKMIEEPEESVLFGFATTEFDKVPRTIMGRCIKFLMKPVPTSLLKSRVTWVCAQKGVNLSDEVVEEIAQQANGQVRDAIMLAEQMSYLDKPSAQAVRKIVGLATAFTEKDFIIALDRGDVPKMVEITNDFIESHTDVDRFINKVVRLLDENAMRALMGGDLVGYELLASKIQPLLEMLIKVRHAPEVAPALFRYFAITKTEQANKGGQLVSQRG